MTSKASRAPGYVLICLVVVAGIVAATVAAATNASSYSVTAFFTNSTGLYKGDRVMVLGVPVGTVSDITPEARGVRVRVDINDGHAIPANANAAIVAPTLITGRYVQFAPVYTGGPKMSGNASVPIERTATPVEFDQIKQQLVQLADDVGPTNSDQQGSLNRFLNTTAATVDGNGEVLKQALAQLSSATTTVNASGDDLFGTVRNLQQFTTALSSTDQQVSGFAQELATFSGVLDDNRTELDTVITSLDTTFDQVKTIIDKNRDALSTDVSKANVITKLLVDRIDTLAETLHVLPTAISDLYNIYDPVGHSLTGALGIPDIPDPKSMICALLTTVNAPPGQCNATISRLATNAAQTATSPKKPTTTGGPSVSAPRKQGGS